MALILEDDAVLDSLIFEKNMNRLIESAPENWETLQLYVQHMKSMLIIITCLIHGSIGMRKIGELPLTL